MEKLHQNSGVRENNGETEGSTLPQFLCGWDTHSEFLDWYFAEKGKFSSKNRELNKRDSSLSQIGVQLQSVRRLCHTFMK